MTTNKPKLLAPLLRCPNGPVDARDFNPDAKPGYPNGKDKDGDDLRTELEPLLDDLQERLFAAGTRSPQAPRVLLILQGLDTAGKGGTIRHVIGMMDPQGVHIHSFKRPTAEELAHDFLWRIERELPRSGQVGIFDRSHYEVFPEIGEELKQVHRRGLAGEAMRGDEDPFVRADGTVQYLRWEMHPWRDARGEIGGIVIFTEDVTRRKQAEEALRQSEANLSTALDMARAGYWEYDVAADVFTSAAERAVRLDPGRRMGAAGQFSYRLHLLQLR